MRIGIDASRANTTDRTGTEWYSFYVIQELKRLVPAEIEVVLYSKEPLHGELADLPTNWSSRVLRWPPGFLWTQLRLSWEMIWRRPDLLYVPAHTIPVVHPKKVLLVVHDVGFAEQEDLYDNAVIGYSGSFLKRVLNACVRLCTLGRYGATELDYHRFSMDLASRAASTIATVSAFSKDRITALYPIPEERVVVIPNGRNTRAYRRDASRLEALGVQQPYILYLGRVEEKKNIGTLVEAFGQISAKEGSTVQLVLAGKAGLGRDRFMQRANELGCADTIVELGWTAENDVEVLLPQASVFVLPSKYEGFGIPVIEAMDAGTPVVCSNIPALREVAGDAALFFEPEDVDGCVAALERVVGSVEEQDRLRAAGRAQADLYSWERTGEQTWEQLQHLLQ